MTPIEKTLSVRILSDFFNEAGFLSEAFMNSDMSYEEMIDNLYDAQNVCIKKLAEVSSVVVPDGL